MRPKEVNLPSPVANFRSWVWISICLVARVLDSKLLVEYFVF